MVGSSMPLMNCMLLAMATTRRAASGARTEARTAAGRARVKAAAARGAAQGAGGDRGTDCEYRGAHAVGLLTRERCSVAERSGGTTPWTTRGSSPTC